MKNNTQTLLKKETSTKEETKQLLELKLVIYNDDVNTFQHVIECLIEYCNHSSEQAEQCAYIIHRKGKYCVKNGSFEKLKPMAEALLKNDLSVKIE